MVSSLKTVDVALIGGGIMSTTLGALIHKLQPDWSIHLIEKQNQVATESSNPWNNAGTGHAALCELNYMPEAADGSVDAAKAVSINEQFQVSRQFWAYFVSEGDLPEPEKFINSAPHMTFVHGDDNVNYLKRRYDALKSEPLFAGIEYSEDPAVIYSWAPTLMRGRSKKEAIAATRVPAGTDVDFGALTHALVHYLTANGATVQTNTTVTNLDKQKDGTWIIKMREELGGTPTRLRARFVFVGAGGGALHLLQKSGIPEAKGFGGFPISGQFYRTDNPAVVAEHKAKVYGKAAVGAPPMSVPHLDARVVDGESSLLFGPYAGFSPKFLKKGSWWDLPGSVRAHNLGPMLAVGRDNFDLVRYLVGELLASKSKKFKALQEFMPTADPKDWYLITAGQRVQVMKKDAKRGGVLQFGTEVVAASDGSIAGLLGASPGASTAVPIMLDVLAKCFPAKIEGWKPTIAAMIPSYGSKLSDNPARAQKIVAGTAKVLRILE